MFYKLVKAKHDELLREDIIEYDAGNSNSVLLEHYVVATDDKDEDWVSSNDIGETVEVEVDTVTLVGAKSLRCYTEKCKAYKDTKGEIWMDADLYEEVFC